MSHNWWVLFVLHSVGIPDIAAFHDDIFDVAKLVDVVTDVASRKLDFALVGADELALVAMEQAIIEMDFIASGDDDLRKFLVAHEQAVFEHNVARRAQVHDLIGAVADDAVVEAQLGTVQEVDAFHAASIEVAMVDGHILAILEGHDTSLAITSFGMAHDEVLEPDVRAIDEAEHIGITRLDAEQVHVVIGTADGQIVDVVQVELRAVLRVGEVGTIVQVGDGLDIDILPFAIELNLIGIILGKVLQLILEIDIAIDNNDAVAAERMDKRDGIIDMNFFNLLRRRGQGA